MKKTIAILCCGFAVSALTLGLSTSRLESKENKRKAQSKTTVKSSGVVKEESTAKSSATKKQPAAGEVDRAPLAAPSGITVTGETISWQILAGGGQFGTSTNFGLSGTIGEPAVGDGFSTNFGVLGGFEQNFGAPAGPCCLIAGNANGDDKVNIADVSFVIAWLFAAGPSPVCCAEGNANGDDKLNIADVSYVISWLFAAGPDPICGPPDLTC